MDCNNCRNPLSNPNNSFCTICGASTNQPNLENHLEPERSFKVKKFLPILFSLEGIILVITIIAMYGINLKPLTTPSIITQEFKTKLEEIGYKSNISF